MDRSAYRYSVVIPMYKSELTIAAVVDEVVTEFARLEVADYEIILVNDGSPDRVIDVAIGLAAENERITVVDLTRNFGQGFALVAGLKQTTGDYIITMDDDMQTPGYELGSLIDAILERDDDIVFAAYDTSEDNRSIVRRLGTRVNWLLAGRFIGKPKGIQSNSFRIMKRFVRDAYVQYKGHRIYSYGIMYRCTDKISNVTVERRPRAVGQSGYSTKRLIGGLLSGVLTFSPAPLRLAAVVGFFLMVAAVIGMIVAVAIHRFYIGLFWGVAFICSIQLLGMGILGEYIYRIFVVEMDNPRYIIRRIITPDEAARIGGIRRGDGASHE